MLGTSGSRLRMDSFDVRRLDPSITLKFNVTQKRRGLFGYSNQRIVILHLKELTMNVLDKKGFESRGVPKIKSYKTHSITRLAKSPKGTQIGVHMQRNGDEEVVKVRVTHTLYLSIYPT
jgi:hypothetical protein